jgi:hypothetical protein
LDLLYMVVRLFFSPVDFLCVRFWAFLDEEKRPQAQRRGRCGERGRKRHTLLRLERKRGFI